MSETNGNELIEKIRKLFRLADPTRGASKAEAELAMQRAQALMTKHGIDQIEVEAEDTEGARSFNINHIYANLGRPRCSEDTYISRIVIRNFNVRILWSSTFVRKDGRLKEFGQYIIVGDPKDTEIAKMVAYELWPMMRGLYKNYLKKFGRPDRSKYLHSFYFGLEHGFNEASDKGRKEAYEEVGKEKADRYAVVLVGKAEAIKAYEKEKFNPTRVKTRSGRGWSGEAYNEGQKKGRNIKLGAKKLNG